MIQKFFHIVVVCCPDAVHTGARPILLQLAGASGVHISVLDFGVDRGDVAYALFLLLRDIEVLAGGIFQSFYAFVLFARSFPLFLHPGHDPGPGGISQVGSLAFFAFFAGADHHFTLFIQSLGLQAGGCG